MTEVGPKTGGWWLWRKQAAAALVSAVLPRPTAHTPDLSRPLRVAYLRFDRRVGEVLLQTPLFHAHKSARPNDTILAITHPKMVRILARQPHIDRVVPFAWRGFPLTAESRALWEGLRQLEVDVVVDCSDPTIFSLGHALAARLVPGSMRVAFGRGHAAWHNTHVVDAPTPLHEATARALLLGPLGVRAGPALLYEPHPKEPVLVDGVDVVARMQAEPGRHAMLCPGGRLGWRRAQPHHFAALGNALLAAGRTPWLAPGPGEEALCAEVHALCPGAPVLPVTDLDQLAALMRASGVTVCNNSGTMHLAVAAGSRTFALFVRMDPTRWGHHQAEHHMATLDLEDALAPARLALELSRWLGSPA